MDKKNANEKTPVINDPFGLPDRKGGNAKPTYEEKKEAELYLFL